MLVLVPSVVAGVILVAVVVSLIMRSRPVPKATASRTVSMEEPVARAVMVDGGDYRPDERLPESSLEVKSRV